MGRNSSENCVFRIEINRKQTMTSIFEDRLIDSCTKKLSLSFLVTTVWTLEASTCGLDPLSSKRGQTRPADDDLRHHRIPSFNHGDLGRA